MNGHSPGYKKEGSNAVYYDGSGRWYNWNDMTLFFRELVDAPTHPVNR